MKFLLASVKALFNYENLSINLGAFGAAAKYISIRGNQSAVNMLLGHVD
jgi:hypothetical protein